MRDGSLDGTTINAVLDTSCSANGVRSESCIVYQISYPYRDFILFSFSCLLSTKFVIMTEPEGRVSVSITEPRHNEASNLPQEGNHGAPLEPVSSKQSMSVIERIATALVGEPETKFQTTGILPSPEDKASRPRSRAHRDLEKHAVSDHDAFSNDSTPSLPCPMPLPPIEYSRAEYRRVIWKMDLHLIPPLASLWFISLVDRVNLGNALIQGLQDDLKFKSRDLSLIIIIPIIGIIVAEIPCNLLLKRYSPAFMLALECGLLGKLFLDLMVLCLVLRG